MCEWWKLSRAFKYLVKMTVSGSKMSDGTMQVVFSNEGMYKGEEQDTIFVEFYAYAMPNMSRHHRIGPFKIESEAFKEARKTLQQQIRFINSERKEENLEDIRIPFVLKETEEEAFENAKHYNSLFTE